ncbi:cytochrome P450 [Frankia sp. R43]|uniref:cytochrome P450 n=1 Tax=Frankia sp. R43 TaxID=269536 RepID=UPI0006CA453A|nr:cytochrome P450 [Frankia sp. R43]KPM56632.1 cytochrome P450 [Frankia sp. R43]
MTDPHSRQPGACPSGMPRPLSGARQYSPLRQYGTSCPAPSTTRRGEAPGTGRTRGSAGPGSSSSPAVPAAPATPAASTASAMPASSAPPGTADAPTTALGFPGTPGATAAGPPEPRRPGSPPVPPIAPPGERDRGQEPARQPADRSTFEARWPAHHGAARLPAEGPGNRRAAFYHQIRDEHGPVAPVLLEGDIPAWLVLGYREVVYVAGTPALFGRDARIWNAWDLVPSGWPLQPIVGQRPSLRSLDGPAHTRRLAAIGDVVGRFESHDLRARVTRGADTLIDAVAGNGRAELMSQYAGPLPAMVNAEMWGLPAGDLTALARDLTLLVSGGTGARDARRRVHAMLVRVVRRRRDQPCDDAVSALIAHPAELTDEEIVEDVMATLTVAQAPTADWIGNTLRLMLTDDRFAVDLAGGRLSVGGAMAEVLWADPPIQNLVARWARRDLRLGGRWIRSGDLLIFGLSAANTDPRARPRESGRAAGNNAHLAFGHGEHRCPFPAQMAAETIATTAVEVLLDRLPDLELAVEPTALLWRPSVWVRGLATLPVRFTSP